jgi:hypothetical protein
MLTRALPISIPMKITKSAICLVMVQVWVVLKIVVLEPSISQSKVHLIQAFVKLMECIESTAKCQIDEDANAEKMPSPVRSLIRII